MLESAPFRVITLNILYDPHQPTWSKRAPLVVSELCDLAPDIVLLQEVAWPEEQATALAAALSENTGLQYTAVFTGLLAPNGWQEGLAVLTRFPIVDYDELQFPRSEKFCQRVRLSVSNRVLDVYNAHLDPFSQDRVARQVQAILAWAGEYNDVDASILGGDFNATPDSGAISPMYTYFRSAYAVIHGESPDYTAPNPFRAEWRIREGLPVEYRAIDYLDVSTALSVADARLVFTHPSADDLLLYPSDHYGLCADLRWKA